MKLSRSAEHAERSYGIVDCVLYERPLCTVERLRYTMYLRVLTIHIVLNSVA